MTERFSNDPPSHPTEADDLSPLAVTILQAAPSPAYERLVVPMSTPPAARAALDGVLAEQLLASPVRDADDARGLLGGLWLWHERRRNDSASEFGGCRG